MKRLLIAAGLLSFATLAVSAPLESGREEAGVERCASIAKATGKGQRRVESATQCAEARTARDRGPRGKAPGPLIISTPPVLPPGGLGQGYSFTLLADGGMPPYSFGMSSGSLPPGLTITSTGVIEGTPVLSGVFAFAVMVSDSGSQSASKAFTLTIFDGVPDPLGFVSQTAVPLSSVRVSNAVTPTGFFGFAPVSVAGGEYSLDCTPTFTSTVGIISSGQSVCVRHVSASTTETTVTTTLTIGGVVGSFSSTTVGPQFALSVSKSGSGAGTVTSQPPGIACGGDCTEDYFGGTSVTLTASPATGSSFAGWSGDCTGSGPVCQVTMNSARNVTATFDDNVEVVVTGFYQTILGRAPDGGGLAFWSGEANRVVALGADVREVFYAMSISFFSSAEYLAGGAGDSQYVTDLYRTFFLRDPDGPGLAFWQGELASGISRSALLINFLFSTEFSNRMTSFFGVSTVRPEVNLVFDFFRGALGRLPDDSGFNFWLGRLRAAQCQGANAVSAEAGSLASQFFTSAEYVARARSTPDYVGDLYNAFLRRGPGGDSSGYGFWVSQITGGSQTRDQVRAAFVPSAEFQMRVSAVIAAGCLP